MAIKLSHFLNKKTYKYTHCEWKKIKHRKNPTLINFQTKEQIFFWGIFSLLLILTDLMVRGDNKKLRVKTEGDQEDL